MDRTKIEKQCKIRPELPQITASDDTDGSITIITTEEFSCRIQKGYYKGELEDTVLFSCINNVIEVLNKMWNGSTKRLMLTHKLLAKQQGYSHVLDLLGDHLKNKEDEHFLFFQNKVEPIFEALQTNDPKKLFEVDQLCEVLGISTKTGYKLLSNGTIAALKVGRMYRIPKVHVLTYLRILNTASKV